MSAALFATVLDESGNPVRSHRGFKVPMGVGIGLHAAAVVAVLAARVWGLEEPPEPPVRIVFYEAPAPFLGDGGEEASQRPAHSEPAAVPHEPAVDPDRLQPEASKEVAAEAADAREAASGTANDEPAAGAGTEAGAGAPGDPNGRADGRENGTGRGSAANEIFKPGGDVLAPELVLRVEPVYPEAARKLHAEGLVVVEAVISASGVVEDVRVVKSAHPLLDAAAVKAVRQWRYRAGTLNGRAVRVLLTVSVNFSLH